MRTFTYIQSDKGATKARRFWLLASALCLFPGLLAGGTTNIKFPVYFEPEGASYIVHGLKTGARLEEGGTLRLSLPGARSFSLQFAGANRHAEVEATDPLPGRTHYFVGRDPHKWRINVPQYGRVRYRDVYPGIDVVYYTRPGALEYDFVIAPGADPRRIRLAVSGAGALHTENGDLLIDAGGRTVRHARPRIYQETAAGREAIGGRYVIDGHGDVRIQVDSYDTRNPLIVDPMIVYSTLLGGDDVDDIQGLAADEQGNLYVTGSAGSNNFPGSPSPGITTRTRYVTDAYVVKTNSTGTAVVFTAFFGSSRGDDEGTAIALDPAGNIYVTGRTGSSDFPVTSNAVQTKLSSTDAFLVKLDPTGSQLLYSTLLGGSNAEYPQAVAVSSAGHAVVAGYTYSMDFPRTLPGASPGARGYEAFAFRLDTVAGRLVYSLPFGGSSSDQAYGVALDSAGNAYITGTTSSADFPVTANAFQRVFKGNADTFVVKLNPAGNAFIYSTLLGGSNSGATTNVGNAIAVDAAGNAYVTGTTNYPDFPSTTSLTPKPPSVATGAYITKLSADGSALAYSSTIGNDWTYGFALALAPDGQVWIAGTTLSKDFPTITPTQRAWGGGPSDWFLCRVNAAGTALTFSTFIGGMADEGGLMSPRRGGVVVDAAGTVAVAGHTTSADFSTTGDAFQRRYGGYATAFSNAGDGFIVRIDPTRDPAPVVVTAQDRVITTIAGGGTVGGATSGPATQASIGYITAMTLHHSGAVLFASQGCGGATIIGGHVIPGGCWSGPIRSVSPDGFLRVVALAASGAFSSGEDGPALQTVLDAALALATDSAGNIYIAEAAGNFPHNRVWKVDAQGMIRRIAGTGAYGFSGDDGPARDAQLAYPSGLAVDKLGNIYIADHSNGRIRKVAPDGTIKTIAGGGTVSWSNANGISAVQARIDRPTGIALDTTGNIYFLERPNSVGQTIRKVTPNGVITTIAGSDWSGYNGDARPALGARFNFANSLAIAPNGEIYVADTGNNRVRRIDGNGMIWDVAGILAAGSSGDFGPGEQAQLDGPLGIAFDAEGNLYIAESHRVRKLAAPRALPKFDVAGVVTAAGYRPGVIARGSIFTVFGAGIGPAAGLASPGYPLGSWLSDVTVRVQQGSVGVNAIPIYVSAGQINAIMPSDAPLGDVQLQVLYAGFPSATVTMKVVPTNFQFFVANDLSTGIFQTVVSPTNYPLCTRTAPAHPGQIAIAWGTGLGAGSGPDGLSPQGIDLPVDVEVLVGGKSAQVMYKGRAPTFAGVDNVYFVIPSDAPSGCRVPVQVRAGGVDSVPATIAISTGGSCQE